MESLNRLSCIHIHLEKIFQQLVIVVYIILEQICFISTSEKKSPVQSQPAHFTYIITFKLNIVSPKFNFDITINKNIKAC